MHKEVGTFNKHYLLSIKSPALTFQSYDWCSDKRLEILFKVLPVDSTVDLKTGAQVMLVRNIDDGLTNGTIGTIKGFYSYKQPTGNGNYNKKVGFMRNIQVTSRSVPILYSTARDVSSLSKSFHLVEFYLHDVSEHVLIMLMEFQTDIDSKPAVKRIQVIFVFIL
ncbi:hypothetical protein JVT61DRAFT_3895 [Boletus reticuloceps]|uniref:DNA helicase Pif1-like 2B domain-containing protein n=1 Tax=Boletus reticuloceps TaxID=495285 RepID=A0A8I2YMG8_9AGAM|nr:hypothetical protein JVT61DRAFT_3895 [Boletus reticuloceps]